MEITKSLSKLRIDKEQSLKVQLLLQLTLQRDEHLFPNDLKILIGLALYQSDRKEVTLREFCDKMGPILSKSEEKVINRQYVRNRVNELAKRGFIEKTDDRNIRKIALAKNLQIIDKINHVLQLEFLVV